MPNITVIDPATGNTKQIAVAMEASMIVQDLLGEVEYFATLSTSAKTVAGASITKQHIWSLSDGAGGEGLDRHGVALPDSGKYGSLTEAVDDYVALMVEGADGDASTAMAFE
jgi:hypothetical protein